MTGEITCLVPGPRRVLVTRDAGLRWCFGCRQRLPHSDVLLADEDPESWYEPVWTRRCPRCGKDRTEFPRSEAAVFGIRL